MFNKAYIFKINLSAPVAEKTFKKTQASRIPQNQQERHKWVKTPLHTEIITAPQRYSFVFAKCIIGALVDMQASVPANMNWGMNPGTKLKKNQ